MDRIQVDRGDHCTLDLARLSETWFTPLILGMHIPEPQNREGPEPSRMCFPDLVCRPPLDSSSPVEETLEPGGWKEGRSQDLLSSSLLMAEFPTVATFLYASSSLWTGLYRSIFLWSSLVPSSHTLPCLCCRVIASPYYCPGCFTILSLVYFICHW